MKLDVVNSIRRLLKIESTPKAYFTKQEIELIVNAVSPNTNFDTLSYSKALSSTVAGWHEQKTVESHPNLVNLNTIHELLTSRSYRLETLIEMIDEELLSQTKSVRFENNILTIELK